jgi:hypothetical protein
MMPTAAPSAVLKREEKHGCERIVNLRAMHEHDWRTGSASRTTLELGQKRAPGELEAVAGAENQTSNPSRGEEEFEPALPANTNPMMANDFGIYGMKTIELPRR